MGRENMREGIPLNLPAGYEDEALHLRNQLLLFRFRRYGQVAARPEHVDRSLEPRLNQILVPLMSVVESAEARRELAELAREYQETLTAERATDVEVQLLEVVRDLFANATRPNVSIEEITRAFRAAWGSEYGSPVTSKWIGTILRRGLGLKTRKSHGVFVVPLSERPKLTKLYARFGLDEAGDSSTEPTLFETSEPEDGDAPNDHPRAAA